MLRFANASANSEVLVFQLAGYVADKLFYHHGDASLNGTIITMAQAFTGARRYPLLFGGGQFGNRHGEDAGSPRYVRVSLSPVARAAFPAADRYLLAYVDEDGHRAEPVTFVPVVPIAVLEDASNVSEGWNHASYGRSLEAVLAVVEAYIAGDPALRAAAELMRRESWSPAAAAAVAAAARTWVLPPETARGAPPCHNVRGSPHSFGTYKIEDERRIVVTDLPIGVATASFVKRLKMKPFVREIRDCSSPDGVELHVTLAPGGFESIMAAHPGPLRGTPEASGAEDYVDPVEAALTLHESIVPRLNYYADGAVLELGGEEVLPACKQLLPTGNDTAVGRALDSDRLETARGPTTRKLAD